MATFQSQASQDKFVDFIFHNVLHTDSPGTYLEIGAGDAVLINNSYALEQMFGWFGKSIDISETFKESWAIERTNSLLVLDATKADYTEILQDYPQTVDQPQTVDYLSLDVDGMYDTVLLQLPLSTYTFKVITIEHDCYRFGDEFKLKEREILSSYGYHLLCADVSCCDSPFEDWWIHPSAFTGEQMALLTSLDLNNLDHKEIITRLSASL